MGDAEGTHFYTHTDALALVGRCRPFALVTKAPLAKVPPA